MFDKGNGCRLGIPRIMERESVGSGNSATNGIIDKSRLQDTYVECDNLNSHSLCRHKRGSKLRLLPR